MYLFTPQPYPPNQLSGSYHLPDSYRMGGGGVCGEGAVGFLGEQECQEFLVATELCYARIHLSILEFFFFFFACVQKEVPLPLPLPPREYRCSPEVARRLEPLENCG